jgi:hypothetical protein
MRNRRRRGWSRGEGGEEMDKRVAGVGGGRPF